MQFLVDNSMYVVLIISTMILIGVLVYLSRIDSRVRRIERDLEDQSR